MPIDDTTGPLRRAIKTAASDRPTGEYSRALKIPDPAHIADWLRRTPTHVLAELSRILDEAVSNPDVNDLDIPDLLSIAAPLRITVRRRQAQDRVRGARRALSEAGWPQ